MKIELNLNHIVIREKLEGAINYFNNTYTNEYKSSIKENKNTPLFPDISSSNDFRAPADTYDDILYTSRGEIVQDLMFYAKIIIETNTYLKLQNSSEEISRTINYEYNYIQHLMEIIPREKFIEYMYNYYTIKQYMI